MSQPVKRQLKEASQYGYRHPAFVMTQFGLRKRGDMRAWLRRRGKEWRDFEDKDTASWLEIEIKVPRFGDGWIDWRETRGCTVFVMREEKLREAFCERWQGFRFFEKFSDRHRPACGYWLADELDNQFREWAEDQKGEAGQTPEHVHRSYVIVPSETSSGCNFGMFHHIHEFFFATNDVALMTMFKMRWR